MLVQLDLLEKLPPVKSRKKQRFIDAILEGKPPREAIVAAGYKPSNGNVASMAASRLLKQPDIQGHLRLQRALAVESANVSAAMILRELALLAFASKPEFGEGIKVRAGDKLNALRTLAESIGLLKPGSAVEITVATQIQNALGRMDPAELAQLEEVLSAQAAKVPPIIDAEPLNTNHNRNSRADIGAAEEAHAPLLGQSNGHGSPAPQNPPGRAYGDGRPSGNSIRAAEPFNGHGRADSPIGADGGRGVGRAASAEPSPDTAPARTENNCFPYDKSASETVANSRPDLAKSEGVFRTPSQPSLPLDEPARPPRPGRAMFLKFAHARAGGPKPLAPEFHRLPSGLQETLVRFVGPMMDDDDALPASPAAIVDAFERMAPCELDQLVKLMEASDGAYIDEAGVMRRAF